MLDSLCFHCIAKGTRRVPCKIDTRKYKMVSALWCHIQTRHMEELLAFLLLPVWVIRNILVDDASGLYCHETASAPILLSGSSTKTLQHAHDHTDCGDSRRTLERNEVIRSEECVHPDGH